MPPIPQCWLAVEYQTGISYMLCGAFVEQALCCYRKRRTHSVAFVVGPCSPWSPYIILHTSYSMCVPILHAALGNRDRCNWWVCDWCNSTAQTCVYVSVRAQLAATLSTTTRLSLSLSLSPSMVPSAAGRGLSRVPRARVRGRPCRRRVTRSGRGQPVVSVGRAGQGVVVSLLGVCGCPACRCRLVYRAG